MEYENTTGEGLVSDAQLTSEAPVTAVGNEAQGQAVEAMSLAELNQLTGKAFPSKDAALKSIKDTFSYVGKKTEDIEKEVLAKVQNSSKTDLLAKELEEMRKERFFDKNPQYADPNVRRLIERMGGNPADVVQAPEFQDVFKKAQGFEETQKLRTVLESNPRLASSIDSLTKARESVNQSGQVTEVTEAEVASAIKDAYGL